MFKGPETRLVWTRGFPGYRCARRGNPKRGRKAEAGPGAGSGLQSERSRENMRPGNSQAGLAAGTPAGFVHEELSEAGRGGPVERSRARNLQERLGGGWLGNLLFPV